MSVLTTKYTLNGLLWSWIRSWTIMLMDEGGRSEEDSKKKLFNLVNWRIYLHVEGSLLTKYQPITVLYTVY